METKKTEEAILANGCFWCTEAIFKRLKGVTSVMPGYTGGNVENPTYEDVSSGTTGHAEAIRITFDPQIISFEKILQIFFATHDPTTLNRQGADNGTQYRSEVFYQNDTQKEIAERTIKELTESHKYQDTIVTKLSPLTVFYEAEDYHKNYYDNNRTAPYCQVVIDPKVRKLLEEFRTDVKEETT